MRSETSYFNKTIFTKNITRFWLVWALYLLIWLFAMPFNLWGQLTSPNFSAEASTITTDIIRGGFIIGSVMAAVFGILAAMAVFSYLYAGRSADMFHMLPLKRENLFLTNYLSGFGFLAVVNAVVFVISAVVMGVCGYRDLSALWSWLGIVTAMSLFFYSFGVFCAMFTGHLIALPVFYIILNFVGAGIELFVKMVLGTFVFGMRFDRDITLGFLSPLYQVNVVKPVVEGGFACWNIVIGYAVAGLILACLALLIYRKRRIETAGDIVAVRPVKPVFKYGSVFCSALFFGCVLFEIFSMKTDGYTAWKMLACMLPAGFVGYYAAEMLLKKTVHVIKSGLRGWLIFSGVLIILTAAVEFDVFGYERYVPELPEISSAYAGRNPVHSGSGAAVADGMAEDEAALRKIVGLHETIVKNKAAIEGFPYADIVPNGAYQPDSTPVVIRYVLKNGRVMNRSYIIPVTEALLSDEQSPAAVFESLINEPGHILRSTFPKGLSVDDFGNGSLCSLTVMSGRTIEKSFADVTLNQEESYRLYQAIIKDIEAGNIGRTDLLRSDAYYNSVYICTIFLDINDMGNRGINVEKNSLNTIAALKSMGLMEESQFITRSEALG